MTKNGQKVVKNGVFFPDRDFWDWPRPPLPFWPKVEKTVFYASPQWGYPIVRIFCKYFILIVFDLKVRNWGSGKNTFFQNLLNKINIEMFGQLKVKPAAMYVWKIFVMEFM